MLQKWTNRDLKRAVENVKFERKHDSKSLEDKFKKISQKNANKTKNGRKKLRHLEDLKNKDSIGNLKKNKKVKH